MDIPASVTHVVTGYSTGVLPRLDRLLPPASVLVVEEPDIIAARGAARDVTAFRCVAALLPAPVQDERHPARVTGAVPRPAAVRAVVPTLEYAVVAASELAEAWGLPGAGTKAARTLRDKASLRETARAAGLPQPAFARVDGPDEVRAFRSRHGGHCVLKPANRQASLGVQLLGPEDDVDAAWLHTSTAAEPELHVRYPGTDAYLVEQRLRGAEVSVEALVREGAIEFLNITAKQVQDSRYPVELGHVVPADLPEATRHALREAMATLVAAAGFRSGALHAEWILHDGRPYLIECAARLPGGSIGTLIDLAYGGNILADLISILSGRPATRSQTPTGAAAIRFLTAAPGTVSGVRGVDQARDAPGVHGVSVYVDLGEEVPPVTSCWERVGQVIGVGGCAAEAASRARDASAWIEVSTQAGSAPAGRHG